MIVRYPTCRPSLPRRAYECLLRVLPADWKSIAVFIFILLLLGVVGGMDLADQVKP